MCGVEVHVLTSDPSPRRLGPPGRLLGDERLAQEIGAGSERAFTTLFQRYHQQLYRYCRSLTGNDQDAQDALQSALTKALVALREGRRNAPVRPWLFRIAHNESITVIRARNPAAELPAEIAGAAALSDSIEERERLATLMADLRELPEQQRGALVMRELSGLSHEEISEVLQISVGAAKQSILEARRSLMEFVEGRAMTCDEIQRIVSDDDRRSLRSRRVRAHLRDCGTCSAFAQAIPRRRSDLMLLAPMLPAAGSAGLLAKLTGAGSGHGSGGAGLVAGTAAKGVGATISTKAVIAAGAAVVATAGAGAVAVLHRSAPSKPAAAVSGASGVGGTSNPVSAVAGGHSRASLGYQPGRSTTHSAVTARGAGHHHHIKHAAHGGGPAHAGTTPAPGSGTAHGRPTTAGTHSHAQPAHTRTPASATAKVHSRPTVHHRVVIHHRTKAKPHRHVPVKAIRPATRTAPSGSTAPKSTTSKTTTTKTTTTKSNATGGGKAAVTSTAGTTTTSGTSSSGGSGTGGSPSPSGGGAGANKNSGTA